MATITRKQRVLTAMTTHGSISPWYAINQLGDTRLSASIFQLKKDGYDISTEMVKGKNKFGDEIRYAKYSLVPTP
jgi:hypothetical protein